jgi:hypothetical protein
MDRLVDPRQEDDFSEDSDEEPVSPVAAADSEELSMASRSVTSDAKGKGGKSAGPNVRDNVRRGGVHVPSLAPKSRAQLPTRRQNQRFVWLLVDTYNYHSCPDSFAKIVSRRSPWTFSAVKFNSVLSHGGGVESGRRGETDLAHLNDDEFPENFARFVVEVCEMEGHHERLVAMREVSWAARLTYRWSEVDTELSY